MLALERTTNKLSQDIRRAQEMAMAAKEFEGSVSAGGYGAYFTTSTPGSYILFADIDGGYDYDGSSELVEEVSIEGKIEIKGLDFQPCPSWSCTHLIVVYTPPDPIVTVKVKLGAGWQDSTSASGGIRLGNGGQTKNLLINKAGLIYVE